jgi:F-type H+-transporting ATPase subunit b
VTRGFFYWAVVSHARVDLNTDKDAITHGRQSMISLDYSVVYQIVLFLVVWVILRKILFQPYLHLLEERERKTTGAQHDSLELEHEGARLRAEYEEKIAQAKAAGYASKEAILQEARRERESILTEAREEAMKLLEGMRREVETQMQKEGQLAAVEARIIAQEMASKILGRKVA